MSTELGFTCWPHSKPRLGSVWYFKDQCPTGAFIQTLLSMDGQPWLLLEPSLLQHPSLNPAWLQRGERNINSEETDGAIIKSSLSSCFFSHCFRFSGLLPQKQIVLALHMFTLCLFRWSKGRAENLSELMAPIWWPARTSYQEIKTNHGCSPEELINLNISCLLSCNSSNISSAFTLWRLFIIAFTS